MLVRDIFIKASVLAHMLITCSPLMKRGEQAKQCAGYQ